MRFENSNFRPAGTGVLDSFVRIQKSGTEQGYNTSGRGVPFDEKSDPNYTRDLTFGEVPTRSVGGMDYKEFILDINQINSGDNRLLSLDRVKIYTSSVGSQTTTDIASLGTLCYDLDAGGDSWIRLDYNIAAGSGEGDMRMLVPASFFGSAGAGTFIYLYSYFGTNHASNDGYEEWAILDGSAVVPLPPMALSGAAYVLGFMAVRRVRAR